MATTDVVVICHTSGCANEGVPIRMPGGTEMDGEWMPMTSYTCGVCWQPITDIKDPEAPPVIDNTLPAEGAPS